MSSWYDPAINLGSSTVVRVVDRGEEDTTFVRRPVGFAPVRDERPKPFQPDVTPQLWEGDQA